MTPERLAELAEARLDGDTDEATWLQQVVEAGPALEQALARAQRLRAALAGLPRIGLSASSRADILDRVRATSIPSARTRGTNLRWWTLLGGAAMAAALVAAILPRLIRPDQPVVPTSAQCEAGVSQKAQGLTPVRDGTVSKAIVCLDEIDNNEDGRQSERLDRSQAVVAPGDEGRSLATAPAPTVSLPGASGRLAAARPRLDGEGQGDKKDKDEALKRGAHQGGGMRRDGKANKKSEAADLVDAPSDKGEATGVLHPAKPASSPPPEPRQKQDPAADQRLAKLALEAREFQAQHPGLKADAMPDEVKNEVRRIEKGTKKLLVTVEEDVPEPASVARSSGLPPPAPVVTQPAAETTPTSGPAEAKAKEVAKPPPAAAKAGSASAALDCSLALGQDEQGQPTLQVRVHSGDPALLARVAHILVIEGLDAASQVTWRRPVVATEGRIDGPTWQGSLSLAGQQAPPASVTTLRLRVAGQMGPLLPWP